MYWPFKFETACVYYISMYCCFILVEEHKTYRYSCNIVVNKCYSLLEIYKYERSI